MKKIKKVLLLILCLSGSVILHAQENDWVTVTIKEQGYQVDFPIQPVEKSNVIPSPIGELTMKYLLLDNSSNQNADNLVYMSAYTAYPEEMVKADDVGFTKNLLDGAVNGAVTNVGGKLISQKEIDFKGYPGREAKIEFQSVMVINQRIILVDNLLYICQTICQMSNDDNQKMKTFFDSFDLTEEK